MKNALAISNILSWVNLLVGGAIGLCALFMIVSFPPVAVLISVVLIGCIVLHSYAAIQLRKSILNSSVALNRQTPAGIRLMGYMALFFAVMLFSNAIIMLQNAQQLISQAQFPKEMSTASVQKVVHVTAVFILLFSACIIVNVVLNLRFLKWYLINREKQGKNPGEPV
jgi:hypothetical protein